MKFRSPIELDEEQRARLQRLKGLLPRWPKSERDQLLEEVRDLLQEQRQKRRR